MNTKEKIIYMDNIYKKLEEAENSVKNGEIKDGFEAIKEIKNKYGI